MNLLLIGSGGRLGSRLCNILSKNEEINIFCPTHNELCLTDRELLEAYCVNNEISHIVLACGTTMNTTHEIEHKKSTSKSDLHTRQYRDSLRKNNIESVLNVSFVAEHKHIHVTFISTAYVFNGTEGMYSSSSPLFAKNLYGWTKIAAESIVRTLPSYCIIRCPFIRANTFEHSVAFDNQITSRGYLNDVAEKVSRIIVPIHHGTLHICGKTQSLYELAKETHPDIQKTNIPKHLLDILPQNTSLV